MASMSAYEHILDRLGDAVVHRNGNQSEARCPSHDDRHASLSIGVGTKSDPSAVLCCQAGCTTEDVLAAMGLELGALYDSWWEPSRNGSSRDPIAVYSYADENGRVLFEVGRFEGKRFFQRRPGRSDWKGGIKGVPRVLYRLPQVIEAVAAGRRIWVVEGEEDVRALERHGEVATCNPGGAGKWRREYSAVLTGATVTVVADRDDAGRAHARAVADSLAGVVAGMDLVESPHGKDARDHLRAGHRLDEFVALQEDAGREQRRPEERVSDRRRGGHRMSFPRRMDDAAFYGPIGEAVLALEPKIEGVREAFLVETLVFYGNAIGRTAYFQVGRTRHHANEYVALAGETSRSRKGSTRDVAVDLVRMTDPAWAENGITGGATSGEGIVAAVRDPRSRRRRATKDEKKDLALTHDIDGDGYIVEESTPALRTSAASSTRASSPPSSRSRCATGTRSPSGCGRSTTRAGARCPTRTVR